MVCAVAAAFSEFIRVDRNFALYVEWKNTVICISCFSGHPVIIFNGPVIGPSMNSGVNTFDGCRFGEEGAMLRSQVADVNAIRAAGANCEDC